MAVDNSFLIKRMLERESMIVGFSAVTNMPQVVCDQESFNDQIFVFENQELLNAWGKSFAEKKTAVTGVKFEQNSFKNFFTTLHILDINEVVFVNESGTEAVELEQIVAKPDYSKIPPQARPVTNPQLQLTGMYFMQEAGRAVPQEEKVNMKDLGEELEANMVRSRYLLCVELEDGEENDLEKIKNKKFKMPVLKNKKEESYQPIFTDTFEYQKFVRNNPKMRPLIVPFAGLSRLMASNVKGYMLNPAGYHILMPKELLAGLAKRFPQVAPQPTVVNAPHVVAAADAASQAAAEAANAASADKE